MGHNDITGTTPYYFNELWGCDPGGSVECYALGKNAKIEEIPMVQIGTFAHFGEFRDGDPSGFSVGTLVKDRRGTTPVPSSMVTSWSAGSGPTRSTVPDGQ